MVAFVASTVLTAANLNTAFNALTIRTVTGTSDTLVLADNGGAVTYSNAAATTSTIPPFSSVAYAVGTRIELMNLGAGVVTVTAGAGVTVAGTLTMAQNTGGVCVKTATNTWSFYQISASNPAGMDLITPTSVAGTGVTLSGGQVSYSGSSTVSVNGCFTAAFENYRIVFYGTLVSGNETFKLRMRLSGTDDSSANYADQRMDAAATTISGARQTAQTSGTCSYVQQNGFWGSIDMFRPQLAAATFFTTVSGNTVAAPNLYQFAGAHNVSTAYDGLTVFPSASTITGTLRIYGYRN